MSDQSETEDQHGDADAYQCEEYGACYHTIHPRWTLPRSCWRCGARRPWEDIGRVEYVRA